VSSNPNEELHKNPLPLSANLDRWEDLMQTNRHISVIIWEKSMKSNAQPLKALANTVIGVITPFGAYTNQHSHPFGYAE
jgi:hypothetical protein